MSSYYCLSLSNVHAVAKYKLYPGPPGEEGWGGEGSGVECEKVMRCEVLQSLIGSGYGCCGM